MTNPHDGRSRGEDGMPASPDRRISQAVDTNGEISVAEKAIRSKRPTPSWLEPVDLSALTAAADAGVDDERSKRRRGDENVGDDAPSTSSETKDDDEVDEDSHVWMREALRVHLLDRSKEGDGEGESTEEVDIAEESLDMLASCLGGVLEKVLAEAKVGAEGVGELTSLDIHKSIKSLFPEKGGEGKKGLRPYLPRVVKDAWRLDKKSLPKGAKKRSGMSRQIF